MKPVEKLTPKVFLVDDDEFVLRSSAAFLARSGWQVRSFGCVDDCLHAIEQEEPDCIVSDLEMPQRTGADLLRLLNVLGFDVPCVIATSRPESALAGQALLFGAVEVVEKPVGASGLAAAVMRGLRHSLATPPRRLRSVSLTADRVSELPPAGDSDFQAIVEAQTTPDLILTADFRIAGISSPYAARTGLSASQHVGHFLFDVMPTNAADPYDPTATSVRYVTESLQRALQKAEPDQMNVRRYDVQTTPGSGIFRERWWRGVNSAVRSADGKIRYITHRVQEVTRLIKLTRTTTPPCGCFCG